MAFVNEPIPEEDQKKIGWARLRNPSLGTVIEGSDLPRWTIDRDQDAFIIRLGGGMTRHSEDIHEPHYFLFSLRCIRMRVDAFRKEGLIGDEGLRALTWDVKVIYVPEPLTMALGEVEDVLTQAFVARGYASYGAPTDVRNILVDFSDTRIENSGNYWE